MGITLSGVGFTYLPGTPVSREVLSSIDLELREGEVLCLTGRTGTGKSTLIQIMGGLLCRDRGELSLDGKIIDGRGGLRALNEAVGTMLQSPERQLFADTVGEDVAFGPRNRGHRGGELDSMVKEALTAVGLDPEVYFSRSPFSLSSGEMRRAALAGVLAMRPRFLLLDEPSSGLDPEGRGLLHRALLEQRTRGVGVLVVTHDWDEVELLADRVAVLARGRIAIQGEKEAVLTQAEGLEAAGLRPPVLVAVFAELRRRGLDLPHCLPSPQEAAALVLAALGGAEG